jgi:hypothetical protein
MAQPVLRIALTDEERETLIAWSRSTAGEHRMVERSRVILLAAEGLPAREIARQLKTRLARVSKWRQRFCQAKTVSSPCWMLIRQRAPASGTAAC